jgi:hypothetical protein
MKLSRLVAYLDQLRLHQPEPAVQSLAKTLGPVLHLISSQDIKFPNLEQLVAQRHQEILDSIDDFNHGVRLVEQEVQALIDSIEPSYFSNSYRLYDQEMVHDSIDLILNRRPDLADQTRDFILSRIKLRTDWRRPGLVIRPGLEDWIEDLVALDPLYLVDTDIQLLAPARERFNSVYRRRLCCYNVHENSTRSIMHQLPRGQIGFVLVYNFFNYKPFEVIKDYLTELYDIMSPGGVLAMSFNDCDRVGGVELFERNFMCYTPGRLIKSLAEKLGFEVLQEYHIDAASTWLELRKSGVYSSIRGGQTLGKVLPKHSDIVDKKHKKEYTQEETEKLRQRAKGLSIDVDHYTTAQLDKLISYLEKNPSTT